MEQRIQLNIKKENKILSYLVGIKDTTAVSHGAYGVLPYGDTVQLFRQDGIHKNVSHKSNLWVVDNQTHMNEHVPQIVDQKKVVLYIPNYSIETFNIDGLKYVLTAYTYINGYRVVVGEYIADINNAIANDVSFRYKGNEYSTKIEFTIVDPSVLTYSDDWSMFREMVCGEVSGTNNTGSVLSIDLNVVEKGINGYIESTVFTGCSGSIPFQHYVYDSMVAELKCFGDVELDLHFNDVYENDIHTYIAETYGFDENVFLVYAMAIKDKENVYFMAPPQVYNLTEQPCAVSHIWERQVFNNGGIQNWMWYTDGLFAQGVVYVVHLSQDSLDQIQDPTSTWDPTNWEDLLDHEYPIITLRSDEIPLTKDVFRYFLPTPLTEVKRINLDNVHMHDYNVSVVNKIQRNTVTINRPDDYKANIIAPVFIRSTQLNNLVIHPEVTENISINLNKYKSMVEIFHIRIEGVEFIEIGRTDNTVIFRIEGALLPNEASKGNYYILNEKMEMVTMGNYIYE